MLTPVSIALIFYLIIYGFRKGKKSPKTESSFSGDFTCYKVYSNNERSQELLEQGLGRVTIDRKKRTFAFYIGEKQIVSYTFSKTQKQTGLQEVLYLGNGVTVACHWKERRFVLDIPNDRWQGLQYELRASKAA